MKEFFKKLSQKKALVFLAFLIALFFASKPQSEKSFKSALLNPKYDVDQIELCEGNLGPLLLSKRGNFWLGELELDDGKKLCFPCEKTMVEKFVSNLKALAQVYEISDKKNAKKNYGLDEEKSFRLLLTEKGKVRSALDFGSVDSRRRIYFSTKKRESAGAGNAGANKTSAKGPAGKILAVDSSPLEPYLTTAPNFWAAAEIFPKEIVGSDQKYRRGKIALSKNGRPLLAQDLDWTSAVKKDYDSEDGNFYSARFVPMDPAAGQAGGYYGSFIAKPSAQRDPEEKEALAKINVVFEASSWTVSKLLDQAN